METYRKKQTERQSKECYDCMRLKGLNPKDKTLFKLKYINEAVVSKVTLQHLTKVTIK